MATDKFYNVSMFAAGCLFMVPAHSQWAVVDAPAIVQLIQEVRVMEQQALTARDQLTQARQAFESMTGDRGMEFLLGGMPRNYLPMRWPQVAASLQGQGGGYPGLASQVRAATSANALLSSAQVAVLSAADRQRIVTGRESSALSQALTEAALANVSDRFASLQELIAAIATASDPKATLDLQARISVELGMLQNEQTKLEVLYQAARSLESVNRQQEREQVIMDHGRFSDRFRPVP